MDTGFEIITKNTVFDSTRNAHEVNISAHLHGRFIAEQGELIFYRRNKFKVLGSLVLPAVSIQRDGELHRITSLDAALDAVDSQEEPVKMFNNSSNTTTATTILSIDPGKEMSLAWEKVQFRHATVKRRGSWQYFHVRVTILANIKGSRHLLCQLKSMPITVRGRSPGSFASDNTGSTLKRARGKEDTTVNATNITETETETDLFDMLDDNFPISLLPSIPDLDSIFNCTSNMESIPGIFPFRSTTGQCL
ncbi:hypothetical protein ASPZODRAFT_137307 [Penicilliopsis zonata CBS 506.65]|uniref:NDT80 domain-containing protein n=1 Tax=Penicilliopsis zonata CBS 506.65 TaxID=1073090 RepID=A0A1L9S5F4_9EURO|nr:hypothetical protein ASPZODRAFT_137307 [Penicilliopsis zonata CBS 506.65]OJJ42385.1 hypothetical protein ASPZODRAFT_137307 [Penicilliopsis zonata CBS 506.65]